MSNSENLLKIIKQVESTHRGIGLPLSFDVLSVLAGQSVFNIASSGRCKTHMIYAIADGFKHITNMDIRNWNSMTYYELVEKLGGDQVNKNFLWTIEEWSMLTEHHRELLMAIGSKIQTDHHFERMVSVRGFSVQINIQNCLLTMLIAIQPFKFRKLMRESDNWNSLAADRFTKLMVINALQEETKRVPPHFDLPVLTPSDIKKAHPAIVRLMSQHLTGGRAELAAINYMNAWCMLNNKSEFTNTDASAFNVLYEPYLSLYPLMIFSSDPDREESFHTGPFRIIEYFMSHFDQQEIGLGDLIDAFHLSVQDNMIEISTSSLHRHLALLKHKGILTNNSPTWSLSPKYRNFFESYKRNWSN